MRGWSGAGVRGSRGRGTKVPLSMSEARARVLRVEGQQVVRIRLHSRDGGLTNTLQAEQGAAYNTDKKINKKLKQHTHTHKQTDAG